MTARSLLSENSIRLAARFALAGLVLGGAAGHAIARSVVADNAHHPATPVRVMTPARLALACPRACCDAVATDGVGATPLDRSDAHYLAYQLFYQTQPAAGTSCTLTQAAVRRTWAVCRRL